MFLLLNNLLDIFILATGIIQDLACVSGSEKPSVPHPREGAPPQPVHCPKLDVNTSNAMTPFLTSPPHTIHRIYSLNFELFLMGIRMHHST